MLPDVTLRLAGTSFKIALVITDLPEPLSPTINKISPLKTSKSAFSTAKFLSAFLGNAIVKSLISKIGLFNLINPLMTVPLIHLPISLILEQMKQEQVLLVRR